MLGRYVKARFRLDSRRIFLTLFAPNVAPRQTMTPSRGPNCCLLQFAGGAFPQSKENHQARQEFFWKNNCLTAVSSTGSQTDLCPFSQCVHNEFVLSQCEKTCDVCDLFRLGHNHNLYGHFMLYLCMCKCVGKPSEIVDKKA